MKLTKTEIRVRAAFKLLIEAEAPATLFGLRSIFLAAGVVTESGRKPTEGQVYAALAKMAKRGEVEKTTTVGMGGGFTCYRFVG